MAHATGIEILRIPYRTPRANAICERFVGSVRRECIDQLLICGERQLYRIMREYTEYFNRARPHQGLRQRIPEEGKRIKREEQRGKIISFPVVGGLHHNYRRAA